MNKFLSNQRNKRGVIRIPTLHRMLGERYPAGIAMSDAGVEFAGHGAGSCVPIKKLKPGMRFGVGSDERPLSPEIQGSKGVCYLGMHLEGGYLAIFTRY